MSRVGSSLAPPARSRLVGGVLALVGIALLVIGVLALRGGDDSPPVAAPTTTATPEDTATTPSGTPSTAATTVASTTTVVPPPPPSPRPSPSGSPEVARAPLTVLNNSTIAGLADQAAAAAERRGWDVAQVGNFAGRLPMTTAYYTPGNAAEERAARQLAAEFPQVGQVLPRYAGLPPTPAGVVLVVTRDWS